MTDDVADYYNTNTASFLRFGRGSRSTGTIHRALWGPGITSQRQALDFVHARIIRALRDVVIQEGSGVRGQPPLRPADLGCGVGASMVRISTALNAEVGEVTISPVQQHHAQAR
ncbi:MAG: hypothetical protein ACOCYB_05800 [Alkalispirochaeta sp.]